MFIRDRLRQNGLLPSTAADRYMRRIASLLPDSTFTILDVGSGPMSPLSGAGVEVEQIVTLDLYHPASALAGLRHLQADAREILEVCGPNSYDAVVALEFIEHLPHADGGAFLAAAERVARRAVIISTPNGYVPQGAIDGNPGQVHLSGWTPGELRDRGYRVWGVRGLKRLRGEEGVPRLRPRLLGELISDLTAPFERFPSMAFQLIATKDVS